MEDEGALQRGVRALGEREGVPPELVLALARVEGGLALPARREVHEDDFVPVAGILELRHGAYDSLARGAALMGTSERALREDTDLGTEAGVRVLAELGRRHGARGDDLASWREAVAELSGLGETAYREWYLAEVYATLRDGGRFPARGGEMVRVAPHPEVARLAEPRSESDGLGVLTQGLGTPQYPGATWFETSCTAAGGKCNTSRDASYGPVNKIVIHDTEGGWNASVATLQYDGGKSVHYLIDADGSRVAQFIPEEYDGWHAGNSCYNNTSIGIEHVGVAADPAGYSPALYARSVDLVRSIRTRWNVPLDRDHIVGHYQVPNGNRVAQCGPPCSDTLANCEKSANYGGASNHRDPGLYWQWCQYFQRLGGSCRCADAYANWNCTTDRTQAVRCAAGTVEIADCAPCEVQPVGTPDVCHAPPLLDAGTPDLSQPDPEDLGVASDASGLDGAVDDSAVPDSHDGGAMDAGEHDGAPDLARTGDGVMDGPAARGCACAVAQGRAQTGASIAPLWLVALWAFSRGLRRRAVG